MRRFKQQAGRVLLHSVTVLISEDRNLAMHWKCKYCLFSSEKRAQLFKHYRLKHGSYARTTPIPCLHTDCLCSFKSFNALKVHLTRNHSHEVHDRQMSGADEIPVIFHCPLCNFEEPCTELTFFFTFALRRQELVNLEPPVKDTMERWPALFTEAQIVAEFCRLSSKSLSTEFFKELDKYTPRFFEIFKTKGGSVGKKLQNYLQQVTPESTDVTAKRTAVLRGLPVILGDENTDFFKTCFDCDDPRMSHIPIGILTTVPEDEQISLDSLHLQPSGTAIILEGRIAMDGLENLPHAMCLLFGLTYALNLEYPQQLKYTFDFIQRVLLSLGHKSLKPKIQSLKNRLMQ